MICFYIAWELNLALMRRLFLIQRVYFASMNVGKIGLKREKNAGLSKSIEFGGGFGLGTICLRENLLMGNPSVPLLAAVPLWRCWRPSRCATLFFKLVQTFSESDAGLAAIPLLYYLFWLRALTRFSNDEASVSFVL